MAPVVTPGELPADAVIAWSLLYPSSPQPAGVGRKPGAPAPSGGWFYHVTEPAVHHGLDGKPVHTDKPHK